jgi:hypothetical protein
MIALNGGPLRRTQLQDSYGLLARKEHAAELAVCETAVPVIQ